VVSGWVAHQASELLAAATWHPWRSASRNAYRTRHLRQVLEAGMPGRAELDRHARATLRTWERELRRAGKNAARKRST
jgi:hypothetical protein